MRSLSGFRISSKEVGRYAWLVSVVVLAVALARRGRPIAPLALLVLGGISFWYTHEFPSGSIGMYLCFLAVLWLEVVPQGQSVSVPPHENAPATTSGVTSGSA